MAEALYRKYRPQVFEDVVGQEPIERTLKNALRQDKVSHAYLFCGPRGTGKTTTARLLAKALLCQSGPTPDPDGTCEDCALIAEGVHPDVYELDAASRTGVENVREEIISRVQFAPTRGRYKVYIIDEVHMLSTAAFNALLKTLEEPPGHVVFILCTTDPQKVPETIHSRCQRFDFRRIAPETMVSRLGAICMAEGVQFEGEALDLIAQRAEGGLRNALTSLEQIIAFENGAVTLAGAERLLGSIDSTDLAEIMSFIGRRDIASCFKWTADYVETGADLAQFVRDMSEHVRNLYVMAFIGDDADLEVPETARRQLAGELQWFGPDRASRLLAVLGDLSAELKTSSNPRLAFEIALTRMVRPDSDLTLESLAERIEALESGYSSVSHVLPGVYREAGLPGEAAPGGSGGVLAYSPDDVQPDQVFDVPAAESSAGIEGASAANVAREVPADALAAEAGARGSEVAQVEDGHSSGAAHDAREGAAGGARQAEGSAAHDRPAVSASAPASAYGAENKAPASSNALSNPASLQRIWQAAMVSLKKRKQAYGVLFMNTKAVYAPEDDAVHIVFPAESAFAFNAVQKADVREALEESLGQAAGGHVSFTYERANASAVPSAQERQAASSASARRAATAAGMAAAQPVPAKAEPAKAVPAETDVQPNAGTRADEPRPESMQDGRAQQRAEQRQAQPQVPRQSYDQVPYDQAPYDQVPYEDFEYEQVPYEEFDAPVGASAGADLAAHADASAGAPDEAPTGVSGGASNGEMGDAASVEAMLQAGFGGNVVFREIDE